MKILIKIAAMLCLLGACQFGWAMESKEGSPKTLSTSDKIIELYKELLLQAPTQSNKNIIWKNENSGYSEYLYQYSNGLQEYVLTNGRSANRYFKYKDYPIFYVWEYAQYGIKDGELLQNAVFPFAGYVVPSSSSSTSSSSSSPASAATASATTSAQTTTVMAPASNSSAEEKMESGAYVPTIQTTACSCITSKSE